MSPEPGSFWDALQMSLLRGSIAMLARLDAMLNVHWGERIFTRWTRQWQQQLNEIEESQSHLEQSHRQILQQKSALAIQVAAIHLAGRWVARQELRFDPSDPHDEKVLDASIELLVKDRLAAIQMEEGADGRRIYILEPDWAAIRARLVDAAEQATSEVADWLWEGIQIIDQTSPS